MKFGVVSSGLVCWIEYKVQERAPAGRTVMKTGCAGAVIAALLRLLGSQAIIHFEIDG